ncbi:ribosomal protein S7 domain-containing protein [Lasiosphaeria hispida]|uniref:Small ribosomal subunit protein uS7m n=1 Tax=Lasiosphaeria hispida TaxID=260671 RepID=A0AAJ0MCS8_9PEZI|nr:ribosomal protein S7 domain-containing protein [Lasiosphaeria hispida]
MCWAYLTRQNIGPSPIFLRRNGCSARGLLSSGRAVVSQISSNPPHAPTMPPRLNIWSACQALSVRPRSIAQWPQQCAAAQARGFANDRNTTSQRFPDQNASNLPPFAISLSAQVPAASENEIALSQLQMAAYGLDPFDSKVDGHKFGMPDLPLPRDLNHKHRYDPVVVQITKLLMRDGKLSKAQRDMAMILNYLRTSPPPKINPARPLLPGSPAPSQLPLDPVLYLTLAIDSVAPLVRMRAYKGMAGGGRSLEVPMPLEARQRRRTAFQWILDVVNKKPTKGSGRAMFPNRVAEEIVAVVEGRSGVWDKRQLMHKQGTAARANLNHPQLRKKGQ